MRTACQGPWVLNAQCISQVPFCALLPSTPTRAEEDVGSLVEEIPSEASGILGSEDGCDSSAQCQLPGPLILTRAGASPEMSQTREKHGTRNGKLVELRKVRVPSGWLWD